MSKAFNKGDAVTYINSWDNKGTCTFRHATVYSCGNKQMVLTDAETGEEMGRNFAPCVGAAFGTFKRMSDDEAVAFCLISAAAYLEERKAYYSNLIAASEARCASRGYINALQKDLEELHEPRAMSYSAACEAVRGGAK